MHQRRQTRGEIVDLWLEPSHGVLRDFWDIHPAISRCAILACSNLVARIRNVLLHFGLLYLIPLCCFLVSSVDFDRNGCHLSCCPHPWPWAAIACADRHQKRGELKRYKSQALPSMFSGSFPAFPHSFCSNCASRRNCVLYFDP
jgi:hypothetical protein